MKLKRSEKLFGMLVLAFGCGVVSVMIIPRVGWVVVVGVTLVIAGLYLLRRC